LPTRRQHDYSDIRKQGLLPNSLHESKSVNIRHVRVGQNQGRRQSSICGAAKLVQCRCRAAYNRGGHFPAAQRVLQYQPVRRIVIHHQHRHSSQLRNVQRFSR
jgi:hypothetical protein